GEAREIASQYAALSLLRQARRSGAIIVVASGALYIAMKGRVAWYGLMQWALSDAMQPVGKVVLAIDRTAYVLAFLLGRITALAGVSLEVAWGETLGILGD